MATTRKPSAKKAATKKASARKKAASKADTLKLIGSIPKIQLSMKLDAKKIAAIQRCIEKGTLNVSVSKVDLSSGKLGGAWLYD